MLLPLQAYADSYEKLLMPGPVVKGHAKYESECTKCHVLFKKGGQNEKCMECHDLDNSPDFHETDAFEDIYWPEVEHYGPVFSPS